MKMKSRIFLLCFTTMLISQLGIAQKIVQPRPGTTGEWRLLGTTHADFKADHDAIIVSGPFDNFRKLKFKVTDASVDIMRFTVTYDNGQVERIDTRFTIPQGGDSRIIDLAGGSRSLRRVDFWYDTKGLFRGKADITLFGRK